MSSRLLGFSLPGARAFEGCRWSEKVDAAAREDTRPSQIANPLVHRTDTGRSKQLQASNPASERDPHPPPSQP
jgi:hypothetical protein